VYFNFGNAFIFLLFGATFVVISLFLSSLIRPSTPSAQKQSTYECGEVPLGDSWIQFNLRFYVIALIFLIFEVEVIFMFPWAVVLKPIGAYALVEMMIFLGILLVGFAYVWRKGDLDWVMAPGDNLADSFKRDAVSDVESDERETTVEPLPTT
jgi:NADH-quinone oxidoreductase subunit A